MFAWKSNNSGHMKKLIHSLTHTHTLTQSHIHSLTHSLFHSPHLYQLSQLTSPQSPHLTPPDFYTPHIIVITKHRSSHLTSFYLTHWLTWSHLTSPYLISTFLISLTSLNSSHITYFTNSPISPHFTSPYLALPHLISPHMKTPNLSYYTNLTLFYSR